jgi:hypothetical protein
VVVAEEFIRHTRDILSDIFKRYQKRKIMQPKKRKKYECQRKTGETKCLGNFSLQYEDGAPVFVCDKCGERDETWKKFYNEYLKLYSEKSNWKQEKNHVSCLIGLFCYEYKKKYGVDYTFVPRNPNPYSAKECKDAWTMLAAFDKNALETRKYIIWAFKFGIGSGAQITSLAYLNVPGLIRRYKLWAKNTGILRRETILPKEFLTWCELNVKEIFSKHCLETMNNLGAIINYANAYPEESQVELLVIVKATELGLIKDGKLNIGR